MTIPFRNTILVVFAISLFTFIALFGRLPALRKTPIGFTYRIICIHAPNGFRRIDNRYTNGRLTHFLNNTTTYLLYQKNPIVLILFLSLLTGSITLFLTSALPSLTGSQRLPIPILVAAPYILTYLCARRTSPITISNHTHNIRKYPYDHIIYRPHNICRTCGFDKPARSKHCSLCGVCVSKCDHHCPWVNNCLGQHNYRYFLLLLLSLSVMESYGAWLVWKILSPHLHISSGLSWFEGRFWTEIAQGLVFAINIGGLGVAGVGMLAVTTAPLPFGLLVYHCYLIWAGMTTNESAKWTDWRDDMYDGFVWKGKRSVVDAHNRAREARHGRSVEVEEETVPWPIRSDQLVVRTTDGKPPSGQEQLWERCTGLDMVDNIYDLGFWRNFKDVVKGR